MTGQKELLGLWLFENEGAKFWLSVLTELKNRGVKDAFVACVDGLTGFSDAIAAVFPKTQVHLCNTPENWTLPELMRARKALAELPFIGWVERFEESVIRLEAWLKADFPGFQSQYVRANVTSNVEASLQEKLHGLT